MKENKTKHIAIVVSIFIGIVVGLVIASNFNFTPNGFAENSAIQSNTESSGAVVPVNSDLEETSRAFVEIAKRVTPTVVSITSEKIVKVQNPFNQFFGNDDFFRRFFRTPENDGEQEYRQNGLGSGVIVSPDGFILTNYHVIKDADEINVVIDKEEINAEVIGEDPATDLAVIKIDRDNLSAIKLGDSDGLEVGEWVLAIGSPFNLGLEHTVTSGIVSAKGRSIGLSRDLTYQDFIQTDAAINPGNSGGALVNIRGELIGINSAIYSGNAGGNIGIGFAIPVNLAKQVMDDLISHGKVVRGYLGVSIRSLDAELSEALDIDGNEGAVVVEVQQGTPAEKAGLKKYDVIIEVDGKKIEDSQMLTNVVASYAPNSRIDLKVVREGKVKKIEVELTERPGNLLASSSPSTSGTVLGRLGMEVTELTDELAERYDYTDEEGVLVTSVKRGSVAQEKGVRAGDLIVEVNRKKIGSVTELAGELDSHEAGDIVLFQVTRQGQNQFVALKIPKQ